tara:strand:- start:5874 stop:6233 length:360 start_codon:yes stop_codon:yes gene_type:complete
MDDARVWEFETALWTEGADHYRRAVDPDGLMVLPAAPYVFDGRAATAAVADAPRWTRVRMSDRHIVRPETGWIVVAYAATADRGDAATYQAFCTSTYRRRDSGDWCLVQHQQTPVPQAG